MSSNTMNAEDIVTILEYLDESIAYLSGIYTCPCQSCISSSTNVINSLINYIITFFNFIIKNKEFIKKYNTYLSKLLILLPNMLKINNEIINETNVEYFNIQRSISIVYLEKEDSNIYEKPFSLEKFIKYYPELSCIF